MHDIDDLERRGIPSVMVASEPFDEGAKAQERALGLAIARVLTPHPIQDRTDSEMQVIADEAIEKLVSALTQS